MHIDDVLHDGQPEARTTALVAQLVGAELLVLLTDTPGLMDADPRFSAEASLIEEIAEVDHELEALAGGAGTARGSGGMASKLAAAKMASWSGVRAVIAAAGRSGVLDDAIAGRSGVGTVVLPRARRLSARKLWIAFALPSRGRIVIDDGAVRAVVAGAPERRVDGAGRPLWLATNFRTAATPHGVAYIHSRYPTYRADLADRQSVLTSAGQYKDARIPLRVTTASIAHGSSLVSHS